jgi:hypothetical protein
MIYVALLLPVRQKMRAACIPLKLPQLPKHNAVSKLGNTQTKFSPPLNFQISYGGLFPVIPIALHNSHHNYNSQYSATVKLKFEHTN